MRYLLLLLLFASACAETAPQDGRPVDVDSVVTPSMPPAAASDTARVPIDIGAAAARPVAPVRVENACPFECCQYRAWTLSGDTRLFRAAGDTTTVVATLPAGTEVDADRGYVLVTRIGRAVATQPVELYSGYDRARMLPTGDTLLVLADIGEGFSHVWYADTLYQTDALLRPDAMRVLAEREGQWWAHVALADGRTGWLWMDRTPPVRGADGCG